MHPRLEASLANSNLAGFEVNYGFADITFSDVPINELSYHYHDWQGGRVAE